jgi:RNA polymerase subunit RPABC4/transcription elongation factor Spt4
MELGALFVGLAMLVGSLPFVIKPFRGRASGRVSKANILPNPEDKRKADLSALLDLDFDYRTGKVSEEDYSTVRAQLVSDAAQYIQLEKSLEDEQIEEMIAARRAKPSSSQACSNCGHTIGADSHFCSQCGMVVTQGCPSCGKPVQEGDSFCTICGAKLKHQVEAVV